MFVQYYNFCLPQMLPNGDRKRKTGVATSEAERDFFLPLSPPPVCSHGSDIPSAVFPQSPSASLLPISLSLSLSVLSVEGHQCPTPFY